MPAASRMGQAGFRPLLLMRLASATGVWATWEPMPRIIRPFGLELFLSLQVRAVLGLEL